MTPDPFEALETLIGLGVDRVLTSGQEATVLEGLPLITELVERAGDRIIVMPGGGITARNVGAHRRRRQAAGDPFRGAGAGGGRHAIPPRSMSSWAASCVRRNTIASSPRPTPFAP